MIGRTIDEIRADMAQARATTLQLMDRVPDELLRLRVHDFYSPVGWHFGHIGMTEELWTVVEATGGTPVSPLLSHLYANIPENPKEARCELPPRSEIIDYLAQTRFSALDALDRSDPCSLSPLLRGHYAWEFVLQHELQHQETISELLQLLAQASGDKTAGYSLQSSGGLAPMIALRCGTFRMGSEEIAAYDNEREPYWVDIEPFEMDATPVTASQWLHFMEDGGYERRELWAVEGWQWKEERGVSMPEYWQAGPANGCFGFYSARGVRPIDPQEPVSSISWFEAAAFARWAGKRLPSEAEWEFAARFDPATCRSRRYSWGDALPEAHLADFGLSGWQPMKVGARHEGASASGLLDLAGGVWEWTATPFAGYPEFRAFPYDGYSKDHFDGKHYCCRGGSWATSATILRSSFRNWYVPGYRQGHLGLRCAR